MPMVVISRLSAAVAGKPGNEDVWHVDDIQGLVENLRIGASAPARTLPWRSWTFERTNERDQRYVFGEWHSRPRPAAI
jgi:hypothetical protein